jgi:hypothetical protein
MVDVDDTGRGGGEGAGGVTLADFRLACNSAIALRQYAEPHAGSRSAQRGSEEL